MKYKTALALFASCALTSAVAAQDFDATSYAPGDGEQRELRQMSSAALGRYIATDDGHALYILTEDDRARSRCFGACADAWPPLRVDDGEVLATKGLDADLIGVIERADGGMQVTYAGWPLYRYVRDDRPGATEGHDVRDRWGAWLLMSPTGQPKGHDDDGYGQTGYEGDADESDGDLY